MVEQGQGVVRAGDLFEVGAAGRRSSRPAPTRPGVFNRLREPTRPRTACWSTSATASTSSSASPEMYVRVERARGSRPARSPARSPAAATLFEDADRIRELLNSDKDESELTMCTDVDRNDKSRVCEPGSVKVIGRRQIEMYSRLIHTVDHVEGILRAGVRRARRVPVSMPGRSPSPARRSCGRCASSRADERSPRALVRRRHRPPDFDGDIDTGLTLRTIRMKDGIAEIRAGAHAAHRQRSRTRRRPRPRSRPRRSSTRDPKPAPPQLPRRKRAHAGRGAAAACCWSTTRTRFVHTLANYFRQAGAEVETVRAALEREELAAGSTRPTCWCSRPGPAGRADFAMTGRSIELARRDLAGVRRLPRPAGHGRALRRRARRAARLPMHGKPSRDPRARRPAAWRACPRRFTVGRYHSLYARRAIVPASSRSPRTRRTAW